jgi:hydroxyacylglutathione hydrolase
MTVEPNNPNLVARVAIVNQKRERGEPTVPSLLGEEKKANPFLRVDFSDEIRRNIGVAPADTPEQAFAKLRRAKDVF